MDAFDGGAQGSRVSEQVADVLGAEPHATVDSHDRHDPVRFLQSVDQHPDAGLGFDGREQRMPPGLIFSRHAVSVRFVADMRPAVGVGWAPRLRRALGQNAALNEARGAGWDRRWIKRFLRGITRKPRGESWSRMDQDLQEFVMQKFCH
ncbi:hypothetical protein [Microbacterium sp. MMO-10]|uniref:hypothetical protein n=1 Tax=Microbacterium sp. MMO-10 TaxID=3081272 RepID=UPI003018D175